MHNNVDNRGKKAILGALAIIGWVTIVHLGWNLALPDLLGFEKIRFKQAIGLVLLVGALAAPFRIGRRASGSPITNAINNAN